MKRVWINLENHCVIFDMFLILIFRHSDDLHRLVNRYHSALNGLDEMKTTMLAEQISTVQNEIYIGCKTLNWNSLGMLQNLQCFCNLIILLF